jgi:replicative DNA helicase
MNAKIPPQAIEIEAQLLGELISYPHTMDEVVPILDMGDFYDDSHQKIYAQLHGLWSAGEKIDLLILTEQLKKTKELEAVGGVQRITRLTREALTAAMVKTRAYIIKEKAIRRAFIPFISSIGQQVYDPGTETDVLIDTAIDGLNKITDFVHRGSTCGDFPSQVDSVLKNYYERKEAAKKGQISGIRTPLNALTKITGGWQPGDLIIVAARPSMGKTAFVLQCGMTAARLGSAVDFYSLEMTSEQLIHRVLSGMTGVDTQGMRSGTLADQDELEVERSITDLLAHKLNIDDKSIISAEYVKAKSSANRRKGKCDMIIVDYLQLMDYDRKLSRNEGIGSVSRKLKGVAKDLGVPVMLCCQLNRAAETNGSRKPQLSHLRDSGEIEQDADMVIFPYREYYYSAEEADKGIMEIRIEKHRNGITGKVEARHNEYLTQIYDPEQLGDLIPGDVLF